MYTHVYIHMYEYIYIYMSHTHTSILHIYVYIYIYTYTWCVHVTWYKLPRTCWDGCLSQRHRDHRFHTDVPPPIEHSGPRLGGISSNQKVHCPFTDLSVAIVDDWAPNGAWKVPYPSFQQMIITFLNWIAMLGYNFLDKLKCTRLWPNINNLHFGFVWENRGSARISCLNTSLFYIFQVFLTIKCLNLAGRSEYFPQILQLILNSHYPLPLCNEDESFQF